jgi:hypothetical protein
MLYKHQLFTPRENLYNITPKVRESVTKSDFDRSAALHQLLNYKED